MAEWDNPGYDGYGISMAHQNREIRNNSGPMINRRREDGLLDPLAFMEFVFRNIVKILALSVLFCAIGVGIFQIIPFPYKAKAIILVDPREKGVKVSEQVITNIDGNAAVLESIVELVQSDGFLRPLLEKLQVASDPQFGKAAEFARAGDNRRLLEAFKKGLTVFRLGATYVVEVNYTSLDPQKSALYANGIARAFVEAQKTTQVEAIASAASTLSDRLSGLRAALQKSEKAVADFRASNNIVNVDAASTLQQRELTELSQQVAQAKSQTEVWRAQYDQVLNSDGNLFNTLGDPAETQQLQLLGQQRNLINQNLAELNLTFGARHPRIAAERSKLDSLDQQITVERRRLVSLSKKRLDAAIATQNALEGDLEKLRQKAATTETTLVRLAELEREATANREIYENFLSRFKSADQQQGFQNQEARLASEASAPLHSTRPGLALASGVIGALSFILSTMIVLLREIAAGKRPTFRQAEAFTPPPRARTNRPTGTRGSIAKYDDEPSSPAPSSRPFASLSERIHPSEVADPAKPLIETLEKAMPEAQSDEPSTANNGANGAKEASNGQTAPILSAPIPARDIHFAEAVAGLTHIPRSNLRSEFDLERELAAQLANVSDILPAAMPVHHPGSAQVILVSSWFPKEGKTLIAQSIATLAATNQFDSILIKTPANAKMEFRRGYCASGMYRPYSVLDPLSEKSSGLPVDLNSFSTMQAIIDECKKAFALIILDASHVANEKNFARLSSACDRTLIILDRPDENKIGAISEKTIRSGFKNVKVVLNNL